MMAVRGRPWVAVVLAVVLTVTGCGGSSSPEPPEPTAPTPRANRGDCGDFTIAYNPDNGYEASAFVVGRLAKDELGCDVTYLETTSRRAWRLVAAGKADVYLDAYGSRQLRERLTRHGGPVTVLGPNGVQGGVDLLAPYFMSEYDIASTQDLPDLPARVVGNAGPTISTVPALLRLATSLVRFQELDVRVQNYADTHPQAGMQDLLTAPRRGDETRSPGFYLAEGPRQLLGEGAGRVSVQVPGSAADLCRPGPRTTVCSLNDFDYLKIANSSFARSDTPAYNLVYNYRLRPGEAATILELVELSGVDVEEADIVSWINTHPKSWERWLDKP